MTLTSRRQIPHRAFLSSSFCWLAIRALITFLLPSGLASSIATDSNRIVGEPIVQCASDSLSLNFHTTQKFSGRIFVKGYSAETQCQQSSNGVQLNHAFSIAFDRCGLRRSREAGGVSFTTTVVVSFHPIFVTKIDRAFRVNCFYTETVQRTVFQRLDVGPLSTESIARQNDLATLPTCRYDILAGGPDGSPIKFARIGDVIYHKWSCESTGVPASTDKYCMRVHSCSVNDGQGGGAYTVLDREGCEVDGTVLPNLRYIGDLTAGQATSVFMFADRSTLNLNCQVELTMRETASGGCEGAPQCKLASNEPINNSLYSSPPSASPPSPSTVSGQHTFSTHLNPPTLPSPAEDDITDLSEVYRVHELSGVRYELRENAAISTTLTPVEPFASQDSPAEGRRVQAAVRFGSQPPQTQVSPSPWTAEPNLLAGIFDDESVAVGANTSPPASYGIFETGAARQHFDEAAVEGGGSTAVGASSGGIRIRKSHHPVLRGGKVVVGQSTRVAATMDRRKRRKVVDFDLPERQLIVLDLDEQISPSGNTKSATSRAAHRANNDCVSYALFIATLSIAAFLGTFFMLAGVLIIAQRAFLSTERRSRETSIAYR